ncbi:hypothetical protein K438DRAFT_1781403 [Mycena galopus ATCC 62051]|nr:hypothetical protein K438DRAFT_1781403 [Mycena galopus ATCC 62051]
MDRVRRAFRHLVGFLWKSHNSPAFTAKQSNEHETQSASRISRERNRTMANTLEFTLATFNSISRGIPGAGALTNYHQRRRSRWISGTNPGPHARCHQTPTGRMSPQSTISRRTSPKGVGMDNGRPKGGPLAMQLSQFFNSTDNVTSLERHHKVLDRLVNDFAMVMGLEKAAEDRKVAMELHTIHELLESSLRGALQSFTLCSARLSGVLQKTNTIQLWLGGVEPRTQQQTEPTLISEIAEESEMQDIDDSLLEGSAVCRVQHLNLSTFNYVQNTTLRKLSIKQRRSVQYPAIHLKQKLCEKE